MALSKYITDELKARLRADENSIEAGKEGDLWFPHLDSLGKPTLGYGHLLEDKTFKNKTVADLPKYTITVDGTKYNTKDGIPTAVIDKLFEKDLAVKDKETKELIKETTSNPAAQQSIYEMSYQMGVNKVKKFKNMLKAMKEGRWDDASTEVLTNGSGGPSLFSTQTPERANRLADRIRAAGTNTATPTASTPETNVAPVASQTPSGLSPDEEEWVTDYIDNVYGAREEGLDRAVAKEENAALSAPEKELAQAATVAEAKFSAEEQDFINNYLLGDEVQGEAGIMEAEATMKAEEEEDARLDNLF